MSVHLEPSTNILSPDFNYNLPQRSHEEGYDPKTVLGFFSIKCREISKSPALVEIP